MSVYDAACQVVRALQQSGFVAYFAGGWVRDYLLKLPSNDIDIVTSATTCDIQAMFPKTVAVGIQFGIIIVVLETHQFEVATFRQDEKYLDGRRPTGFHATSPQKDAKRRDFTINGIFFDPISNKIYDYVEGEKDLEAKMIRAIGDPSARFCEDRLRMIRAVRYASRFDFTIEKQTLLAIIKHADQLLPAVSMERIWQELIKMDQNPQLDKALLALHKLFLLQEIFPGLKTVSLETLKRRLQHLPYMPLNTPLIAKILELFPDNDLKASLQLVKRFKLSNKEKAFVEFYYELRACFNDLATSLWQWAHLYAHPLFPLCLSIRSIQMEDKETFGAVHKNRIKALSPFIQRLKENRPWITADRLIQLGIPKGPKLGKLLILGEQIAINHQLDSESSILEKLQQHPLWTD